MNNTVKKIMAAVLSCSLVVGGGTYYVHAEKAEDTAKDTVSTVLSNIKADETEAATFQSETVYVITNNDGSAQRVIVSDKLKDNEAGTESVSQADAQKDTPVQIKVSYSLDGNELSADDIAGKSGHVVISYEYTNNEYEMAVINGKEEKIYVPFAAVTGMLLDKDVFTNITVDGGRVISDGSRLAVVGISFPGLTDSLGLEKNGDGASNKNYNIPEKLVIEADVNGFKLGTTYTFVTNYNFSNVDANGTDAEGLVSGIISEVTNAMDALLDGSTQLHDGLVTATDGAAAIADGAKAAYEGSQQLNAGAASAYSGALQLENGLGQLSTGLDTLTANNDALTGGAKQVFDTLLATADSSLAAAGLEVPALTISNYETVINGVIESLKSSDPESIAREKVAAQVNANRAAIEKEVTAAVKVQVTEQVLATLGMNSESYTAAVAAGMVSAEQQAQIEGAVNQQLNSEAVKAIIKQNTDEQSEKLIESYMASDDIKAQIAAGQATIDSSIESLAGLKNSLNSYNTFYQGILVYTTGVASAADGAKQLNSGMTSLASGLKTLSAGTESLETGLEALAGGSSELYEGLIQLRDGAEELQNGLQRINDEAVSKIVDFINNDVENLSERLNAIVSASENYKSYNGLNEAEDGSVKFIYKTEAVNK